MFSEVTVGNGIVGNKIPPMTFSDRGDPWSGAVQAEARAGLGPVDVMSIAKGLIADTLVATEFGWTKVCDLRAGDKVVTFDNGLRPLRAVTCATLWTAQDKAPENAWPLSIPARALGNRTAMRLMPGQDLLIESESAADLYGDAFMLVSAASLAGFNGITRTPPDREMVLYSLVFDSNEVVYANGTVLVMCPAENPDRLAEPRPWDKAVAQTPYRRVAEMHRATTAKGIFGTA